MFSDLTIKKSVCNWIYLKVSRFLAVFIIILICVLMVGFIVDPGKFLKLC